jgi:serine/threonine-protein kinase
MPMQEETVATPVLANEQHPWIRKGHIITRPLGQTTGLPSDLLNQAVVRLRTLALLYAFVFFMAGFFPALLFPAERAMLFSTPIHWGPGVVSIAMAFVVAGLVSSRRVPLPVVIGLGLVFEVVSSYGIAAAEFLGTNLRFSDRWVGLSWVATWVLLFNVVVPIRPGRAVLVAVAAVTSVPAMVLLSISRFPPSVPPTGLQLFFVFFFPYMLVVLMSYVGARVVYTLGTEVSRARELGSYRLTERLGAGGMGEVWRAEHRLLARPAAIKLIRREAAADGQSGGSQDLRRRFEREAQVIASLRSPHTVNLFDFGVADDGSFYYVMELLDGLDTETLVKRFGPQPAERVIHILLQMCHSLSEAESRGLVHRDIKPANVFLCRYGEDLDFVKVLDFGIAKDTGRADVSNTALTMANVIQGTPSFIAPEQAMGVQLDGRADLYSAGCVAYWLLTGQLVFTGETALAVIMHHATTAPPAPSTRTELPIPPELEAIVMRCLEKDRDKRQQTARELAERLKAVRGLEAWTPERAREWWKVSVV